MKKYLFHYQPTGRSKGLGSSLSYDIVTSHRGDVKVKSREGEGSELIIQLPIVEGNIILR